jgi:hypothetical protein
MSAYDISVQSQVKGMGVAGILAASLLIAPPAAGESEASPNDCSPQPNVLSAPSYLVPVTAAVSSASENSAPGRGVDWDSLLRESMRFLTIQHGFRYATEEGTRHPRQPFWKGYGRSVSNLHGWSDGDPFRVNFVGHSVQGAVSGFIWARNDGRYRYTEFGRNRAYWKSRLRAATFAFAYSAQFEIGPFSEATIGNAQHYFPQQGLADYVTTPAIGLAWMIGEDWMDRNVISRLEAKINNRYLRLFLRAGLNPSRSMANMMRMEVPWTRDTRPDLFSGKSGTPLNQKNVPTYVEEPRASYEDQVIAPIEISITTSARPVGEDFCLGGGATAAYRVAKEWQTVVNVGGCKRIGLPTNHSADSLTYMAGVRWVPAPASRLRPYVQALAGGMKITEEREDPSRKAVIASQRHKEGKKLDFPDHQLYTDTTDANGFSVAIGSGVDWMINSAFAMRVAGIDYTRSWAGRLYAVNHSQSLQFSSGLVIRWGTW